jgi:fermentation-respiration switch protein FrsA (DUF1100 family)
MKKRGWRYWLNLLRFGLGALLAGLLFVFYVAFPILNAKGVAHPKRAPVCCYTPAHLDLTYEEASFTTSDEVTLRGWYIPSQNRAAILITHGIGGNRLGHMEQAAALAEHGYGVLLFDLRAHGESGGNTISFSGEDALAALNYLKSREDVEPGRIGAMGLSLGGLVVIQAAAQSEDLKAVVAEGPGSATLQDMPSPEILTDWLWLPFDWVWFKTLEQQGVSAPLTTLEAMAQITPRPILIISGAGQRYERRAMRKYYAAAGPPKTLWEIPEAGHAGCWAARPEAYADKIVDFFDQALLSDSNPD